MDLGARLPGLRRAPGLTRAGAEMVGGVRGGRVLVVEAIVAVDEPQAAARAAIRALGRHFGKGDQCVVRLDIGPTQEREEFPHTLEQLIRRLVSRIPY